MDIKKLTPEEVEKIAEDYAVIYVDRYKKIATAAFEDGFLAAMKLFLE